MTNKRLWLIALSLMINLSLQAQYQLSGSVTDQEGVPLPGATVQLLTTSKGGVSGVNGEYSIPDLKPGKYFAEVAFMGFEKVQKEILIEGNLEMDFQLNMTSTQLGQVIVSANKQLQDIQETPISMTAIQSKQVEELQIKELNELNRVAANFNSYDDGGASFQIFASRGIYTIDMVPAVGIYVDDVPFFNSIGFPTLFSDIDRIEILKGPQGTLYGRNALAGAINIITKRPTNNLDGFVRFGYGNLNQWDRSFGVSLPIIKEKLYVRAHGSYTQRDGYINNTTLNSNDLLGREIITSGLRLNYYPTDKLSITLNAHIEDREVNAYALVGGFGVSESALDSLKDNHPYEIRNNREGLYETITTGNALKVTYDLPGITISSISSLQYYERERMNDDFDFTEFDIQYVDRTVGSQTTFSEELRFNSSRESKLDWTAGIFFYDVSQDEKNPFVNTALAGNSVGEYTQTITSHKDQTGVALFGQAEYQLTEQISALAGLRYEIESSRIDVSSNNFQNGEPFEAPDNTVATPSGPMPAPILDDQFDANATFDALSPKIGLTYTAKNDLFFFAHATRGYRPGGLNEFADSQETAEFQPEFSWNYEVGLKSSWMNNRLQANLTAFYITWRDQQLFTVIDLNSFQFGIDNLGKSTSRGLELETNFVPTKGLSIVANIGYLSTEITDFEVVTFTGETLNNDGNQQGYSPEWNGNLGLNYNWVLGPKTTLFLGMDYIFQSEMFFDPENMARQEAYGLLNGRAGISYNQLEVSAWGKNITDEVYFSYGYGLSGSGAFASYGLPQTYGVTTAFKF